jgi:hypothetical protein
VNEYKRGVVKWIKVGRSITQSHLLFVDDDILFGTSFVMEEKKYKKKLDLYYRGTRRMEVKSRKVPILFNGLVVKHERRLIRILPINVYSFDNGGEVPRFHVEAK